MSEKSHLTVSDRHLCANLLGFLLTSFPLPMPGIRISLADLYLSVCCSWRILLPADLFFVPNPCDRVVAKNVQALLGRVFDPLDVLNNHMIFIFMKIVSRIVCMVGLARSKFDVSLTWQLFQAVFYKSFFTFCLF